MIINMAGGGGGAALNFKVVPGLTQPGTASENTIWVKTERIGAWYFSATQPEKMQEWDVWFPTGIKSRVEFNALKKNAVQVYPLSANQMMNGVLVDVIAKSYQGGEWVDLRFYIYNSGDEVFPLTFTKNYSDATYTKNEDSITVTIPSTSIPNRVNGVKFTIDETIDVTQYKTMKAIAFTNNTKGLLYMAVKANGTDMARQYVNITSSSSANVNKDMELSLDISSVNQAISPVINPMAEGNTSAITTTVKAWWLE